MSDICSIVGEIYELQYELQTNVSFGIMSLSNVTVTSKCVFSMDVANP